MKGVSGMSLPEKRPGFGALMEEVQTLSTGGIPIHIVVCDESRVTRSRDNLANQRVF